ncbi:hypothetical protein HHK36_001941 [Tetracentron sinense]|uniref:Uncharacterized protein n=1 Tax=Tetracentron sinense TaxID=13715 RepID=A0A834ZU94_TETSI|nr:hypothetical protein HHK36_001941 [Tetracentron sinense]
MLDLVLLGYRNSRELQPQKDIKESRNNIVCNEVRGGPRAGDWVIPILESFDEQNPDDNLSEISVSSEEEINEYYDNGCARLWPAWKLRRLHQFVKIHFGLATCNSPGNSENVDISTHMKVVSKQV